jgi:hypothetical protein
VSASAKKRKSRTNAEVLRARALGAEVNAAIAEGQLAGMRERAMNAEARVAMLEAQISKNIDELRWGVRKELEQAEQISAAITTTALQTRQVEVLVDTIRRLTALDATLPPPRQ